MLAEAEEVDADADLPRRKAKTKIGNKKKKKSKRPGRDEEGYETDHQDFCEVGTDGGVLGLRENDRGAGELGKVWVDNDGSYASAASAFGEPRFFRVRTLQSSRYASNLV